MQRSLKTCLTIDYFNCRRRRKSVEIMLNLQQNHFESAMLLPSCAFVVRNVHLCQSLPRQSHKSALRSSRRPPPSASFPIRLLQAVTDTCTISVTPLSPVLTQHSLMLRLSTSSYFDCCLDKLYRLNSSAQWHGRQKK